jgi:hypothetical protein
MSTVLDLVVVNNGTYTKSTKFLSLKVFSDETAKTHADILSYPIRIKSVAIALRCSYQHQNLSLLKEVLLKYVKSTPGCIPLSIILVRLKAGTLLSSI